MLGLLLIRSIDTEYTWRPKGKDIMLKTFVKRFNEESLDDLSIQKI